MRVEGWGFSRDASGPEVALWRAVVMTAFADATAPIGNNKKDRRAQACKDRNSARSWLTGSSRDFHLVCTLAMLEPRMVHDFARGLAEKQWIPDRPIRRERDLENGQNRPAA